MKEWAPKRFWIEARSVCRDGQHSVELDGRQVRTPAGKTLILPSHAMAEAAAEEWNRQEGAVQVATMPINRYANGAIDLVAREHRRVADLLAGYADSDVVCYRAETPRELAARQSAAWDPALAWAEAELGARLVPHIGIVHRPQAPAALALLADRVHALDAFRLSAFHDLVCLSGSLVLGFAAAYGWRTPEEIWRMSRIDEIWQEEQWGVDEEAQCLAQSKRREFMQAKRFWDLRLDPEF